jgi:hypothetical protein
MRAQSWQSSFAAVSCSCSLRPHTLAAQGLIALGRIDYSSFGRIAQGRIAVRALICDVAAERDVDTAQFSCFPST